MNAILLRPRSIVILCLITVVPFFAISILANMIRSLFPGLSFLPAVALAVPAYVASLVHGMRYEDNWLYRLLTRNREKR